MADSHDLIFTSHGSRRLFLQSALASAAGLTLGATTQTARAGAGNQQSSVIKLSEHLLVYRGPVNVGIVRDGNKALLIDCGDASVAKALPGLGITKVEKIVFTHHHRDQACGAYGMAAAGTQIAVPAAEREYFANPAESWSGDKCMWRIYRDFRPHHLMFGEPLRVDEELKDSQELTFGPAKIRVLDTPGHTEGGVSYVVEVDGKRVVFSGDCIYDEGQVWDVYSLQEGFSKGKRRIGGYHGFMGDRPRLVESLQRIKGLKPDVLIPSHGNPMTQPAKAIDALTTRFETCYENYVAISALRHYFPELFTDYEGRPGQMPIRPGIKPPDCLKHIGTTWILVSKTGAAFVMDVGSPRIVEELKKMLESGEIKSVEGLWVTHYHHDHTDGIPEFQQEFDCPCYTDKRLAEVLTNPAAWRLPCVAPEPIVVHKPMEDGQSWQWREFKLTSYFYPGQTQYHDALLAESGDLRMFFTGDSHTAAGIDDYCTYNRNWLGRGVGFQYCISLIEKLRPTHIFNCHVADAFTFTPEEIAFMRKTLDRREKLFGQLTPWEHANYGLDAWWVRCNPYSQKATPGSKVQVEVVVTNHSIQPQPTACRAILPKALGGKQTSWIEAQVPGKNEGTLAVEFAIPSNVKPGRYVVPVDIKHGPWSLPQFAEAVIDV